MSAGFGAGKTTIGAIKLLQLKAANPAVPGLIVGQTWTSLKSTPLRALNRLMPKGRKLKVVDPSGERYLDFGDGVPVYLRTAHNPGHMDGLDVGYIWADEIRHYKKEAYDIMIARARVKCAQPQRVFTSTPAFGWMSDEFDTGKDNRRVIFANTLENLRNLDSDYVADLQRSYSRRLQKAVIEGQFTILEGAVYEAFDPSPTSEWFTDYDFKARDQWGRKTYLFIDPGYRRPAVTWVRQTARLGWTVFHQFYYDNLSTTELVSRINAWNKSNDVAIDEVWVDPAAESTEQATAINVLQALKGLKRRKQVRSIKSLKDSIFSGIGYGIEKTRIMLGDPEIGQEIRLHFSRQMLMEEKAQKYGDSIRGVCRSLAAYHYPEAKDERPVSDKPLKDGVYDHMCDAIRYGMVGIYHSTPELRSMEKDANLKDRRAGIRVH